MGKKRSEHPTDGRPLVICRGGPADRAVYFRETWADPRYRLLEEQVAIGEVYAYLPDERLASCLATVAAWAGGPVAPRREVRKVCLYRGCDGLPVWRIEDELGNHAFGCRRHGPGIGSSWSRGQRVDFGVDLIPC